MDRQFVAYLIIFVVIAASLAAYAYARHNRLDRRDARRRVRDVEAQRKVMSDRSDR